MPKIFATSSKSNSLNPTKPARPAAKLAKEKDLAPAVSDSLKSAQINAGDSAISPKEEVRTRFFDFMIVASLFLIFFLCPMFFTTLTVQGIGFDKLLLFYFLVLLGIVAWLSKGVMKGKISFRKTPLDIPLFIFLVLMIAATVMSIDKEESLIGSYGNAGRGLIAVIVFIFFYYFFVNNINIRRLKVFFWTFISSGILIISFSFLQLLGIFILPFGQTRTAAFNPVGSITDLTIYLTVLLPLLVIAAAQIKEIHPKLKKFSLILVKLLLMTAILAAIVLLVFLNKFTFWPAAILALLILLIFFLSKIVNITNKNLIIPVTVFFLLIIFSVSGKFSIIRDLNLAGETDLPRATAWEIVKNSFQANYYFGAGLSNYYYSFSKYKPVEFNNTPFWNIRFDGAPGLFFESAATLGSIGTLAVLATVFIALIFPFVTLVKVKEGSARPILLGLAASSLALLAFGSLFFLGNSLVLLFVLIFSLSLGFALVLRSERPKQINISLETSAQHSLTLALLFLFLSATVIVMFVIGVKVFWADYYAYQSLKVDSPEQKIEKLTKAVALAPYRDVYYIGLANNYMDLANRMTASVGDQAEVAKNINLAITHAKKAVEINPAKVINNESLALIYENASFYTKGGVIEWMKNLVDSYNKVVELNPNNPVAYFRLALINVARANVESDSNEKAKYFNEAIKQYDYALAKKGNLSEAYYGKGIAYERLNNFDEAIEQLKNAVYSSGQNIDYLFELGRLYYNRGVLGAATISEATQEAAAEGGEASSAAQKKAARNIDINTAEQIFLQILQAANNHANTQYSLALLYKTVGEDENAKIMVERLLNTLQDEQQKQLIKQQFEGLY